MPDTLERPERTDDADATTVIDALDALTMALPHPDKLPARICGALADLAAYLAPLRSRADDEYGYPPVSNCYDDDCRTSVCQSPDVCYAVAGPDPSWPICRNCECPIEPGEQHRSDRIYYNGMPGSCWVESEPDAFVLLGTHEWADGTLRKGQVVYRCRLRPAHPSDMTACSFTREGLYPFVAIPTELLAPAVPDNRCPTCRGLATYEVDVDVVHCTTCNANFDL